jgi:CHAD domain-containing protein
MRIERDESVDQGCKRIVRETLAKAAGLARDEALEADERVHEVRLCLKRARAVVSLVAVEAGKPALRDDRRLREIGRALGPWRDRAVAREALARLSRTPGRARGVAVASGSPLDRWLHRALATDDAGRRLAAAAAALERATSAVGGWHVGHGRRAVRAGFEDAYRRARRAYRRASEDAAPERFHSWRKAVKRLGYQVELLEVRAPGASVGGARLKQLARLLGDLHDLEVLREILPRARRAIGGSDAREELIAVIDPRDRELRRKARVIGATLFARPPSEVGRGVRESWVRADA